MTRPIWLFNRDDDRQGRARRLAEGVNTRTFSGARSMLSLVRVEPHSEGVVHQHPEEQWGYLLEGECVRIQDGREVRVTAGDFWLTPGNTPHGVRTEGSRAVILDVFSPPRADYLEPRAKSSEGDPKQMPLYEQAVALGAATLCDAAGRKGALPSRIQQVCGGSLSGPAFTVACSAGDNLWLHRAIYDASPGDVLVASTESSPDFGYWGDILATAAVGRSLAGLVIDGCVRDVEELRTVAFPVFATGRSIVGTSKCEQLPGSMGRPIRIGNCTIGPGDLVVGDSDGVVIVNRNEVDAVLKEAHRRRVYEEDLRGRLGAGDRTIDVMKLGRDQGREQV